ncbi:hypothetical protein B0H14DRAFT_306580 [Mycena olivaceomarginata]|nr:hypothetical protein B0H14DRAFT_306580 [Mycena olivaceomarginata]
MPPAHHASSHLLHTRPWLSAHAQERLGEEVDREIPRCASPAAHADLRCAPASAWMPHVGRPRSARGAGSAGKKNRKRTTRDWVVCSHRARVLPCGRVVLRIAGSPLFFPPAYLCLTSLVTLHLGAARDSSCCMVFGTHDNDARVYVGMADVEDCGFGRACTPRLRCRHRGQILRPAPPPPSLARYIYSAI